MTTILTSCELFVRLGLVYSILAMGYYVSYTILDFPDLTVEGTFLTGAVVYGILVSNGISGWLGMLAAFAAGALFGALTGVLNVKLKIRPLLCGILVSTALISINLVATSAGAAALKGEFDLGGELYSTINFARSDAAIKNQFPFSLIPARAGAFQPRLDVVFLFFAVLFKILLDLFLSTRRGLLLRAAGNNPSFVRTLARDPGSSRILGLSIGNAFAACSGALYTSVTGNANQSMGVGMVVIGLASRIIGLSLFRRVRFMRDTTKVIFGAMVYQACLVLATQLGIPSAYNKLIMAALFTVALILSARKRTRGREPHSAPKAAATKGEAENE